LTSVRRAHLLWIVCLGLCLAPRLAIAEAAQARVHFDRGRTFFDVEEYRKAIAEFKAAHIEKPDPAFLYNIAECHRRLGEVSDALAFYRRFLAVTPTGDKTRPIVEQRIAELKTVAEEQNPGGAPPGGGDTLALTAPPPEDAALLIQRQPRPRAEPPRFYTQPWFLITVGAVIVGSVVAIWALSRVPEPPGTQLGNQSVF
jgi:tetratricopeptide (TPR) repeat protein